jgi:penicillin-binding protein 1A
MRPDSTVDDSKVTVEGWSPVNFNGRYNGLMSMSEAFARSVNPAVVRLQERIGRDRVIDVGRRLGITSDLKPIPSLALGSMEVGVMELTAAYTPFVNRGLAFEPYGIVEVRTLDGRRLYRHDPSGGRRAIHRQVAGDMKRMLQGAVADGTGRGAAIANAGVGGKTGTSQDSRDAWFVGFAGDTVAGIWFGNDDSAPMLGVTGGGLASQAWRNFMAPTLTAKPVAIRLPTPTVDATRSETGLEVLAKITDLVIDKVTEGEAGDGAPSEAGETAKGLVRWFLDQVPSGEPSPYPESKTDQPREDMGQ